jgi:hypothetical protein
MPRTGAQHGGNRDLLVQELSELLQTAAEASNPAVLTDSAVAERLASLGEIVAGELHDSRKGDVVEVLSLLVTLHWIRYQILPEGDDQADLSACLAWSAKLLPVAPNLIPEPVRDHLAATAGQTPNRDSSSTRVLPGHGLEHSASQISVSPSPAAGVKNRG